jgi:hypothetical protein
MERVTPSRTAETKQNADVRSQYQPGEFSALRQRVLEKEENKEKTEFLINKLTKHSVIIKQGTTFLIIFSVVALVTAVYLLHMQSVDQHLQTSVFRAAVR